MIMQRGINPALNQTSTSSMDHLNSRELSPMQLQNMIVSEQQEMMISAQNLQIEKIRTKELLDLILNEID